MLYNDRVQKTRGLIALIFLIGVFLPGAAFSEDPKTIVVLPFTGGGLTKAELLDLTRVFQESLSSIGAYQLIDQSQREKVLVYLDSGLLTCEDAGCAVRIGKALTADTVVMGTVVIESGKFALRAQVVTVASGRSIRTDSPTAASAAELPQAVRLLASALFGKPTSGPGAQRPATALEDQERLKGLESARAGLEASIAEIRKQKARTRGWGWALLGVGGISAGLSGVCYYLAEQAYHNYKTTSDDDLAAYYRSLVTRFDTLTLVSAGLGVVSVGCSIPLFAHGPSSRAERQELRRIEKEIEALQRSQKETK